MINILKFDQTVYTLDEITALITEINQCFPNDINLAIPKDIDFIYNYEDNQYLLYEKEPQTENDIQC